MNKQSTNPWGDAWTTVDPNDTEHHVAEWATPTFIPIITPGPMIPLDHINPPNPITPPGPITSSSLLSLSPSVESEASSGPSTPSPPPSTPDEDWAEYNAPCEEQPQVDPLDSIGEYETDEEVTGLTDGTDSTDSTDDEDDDSWRLRQDDCDGNWYTKAQFHHYYGTDDIWKAMHPKKQLKRWTLYQMFHKYHYMKNENLKMLMEGVMETL